MINSDRPIQIEVRITKELRDLLSNRPLKFSASMHRISPKFNKPDEESWRNVVLRRDGGRPVCFVGLSVLKLEWTIETDIGTTNNNFNIFTDNRNQIYINLISTPPSIAAQRPVNRSQKIVSIEQFHNFLQKELTDIKAKMISKNALNMSCLAVTSEIGATNSIHL